MEPQQEVSVVEHSKNLLYIDSGSFIHILFNQELLKSLIQLDQVIKIQGDGKSIHLSQIELFHKVLRHLLLPINKYHHDENTTANILSFVKLVDKYYIVCNTKIDDAIYKIWATTIVQNVQSFQFFRFFIFQII